MNQPSPEPPVVGRITFGPRTRELLDAVDRSSQMHNTQLALAEIHAVQLLNQLQDVRAENEQLFLALRTVVRQMEGGHPVGHDAFLAARRAIRAAEARRNPDRQGGGK